MAGKKARGVQPAAPRKPARRVLGNDPFARGAAARAPPPAPPSAPAPAPPPAPEPASASAPVYEPVYEPVSAPAEAQAADALPAGAPAERMGELQAAMAQLLPALRSRLAGLGRLWRLGEPGAPLDPHGMDPTLLERAGPLLDFLYLSWWRVEVQGAAALPAGPLLVVANRAGSVPWDALVLRLAFRRESPGRRDLRPLLDAALLGRPAVGSAARRLGAVEASPASAAALLQQGVALGVFPEGPAPHPWPQRYRIGAFGRGGFAKVALRAGAAIVPCAIVGSEEASPPLDRPGFLADALRLPLLASVPGLPLGPLGGLPLPSRWKLSFGEPVLTAPLGPAGAASPEVVARVTAQVRERLQALLDEGVAARRSVFL